MSQTDKPTQSKWRWRELTSLVVTLLFILLLVTGVILYIAPKGRVANWTGWTILGLQKEQWASVHITSALVFIVASLFHVYFNWRVLIRYLVPKQKFHLKWEPVAAVAVLALVFVGTVKEVPPFSNIIAVSDRAKAYWETRSVSAPYAHAELSTLAEFSEQTGMPLDVLEEILRAAGIEPGDPSSRTLDELARASGLSPNQLFAKISDARSPKGGGGGGGGGGMGRQTLRAWCEMHSVSLETALDILRREGFTAKAETPLRDLAEQKGVSRRAIEDMLLKSHP